jgi:iron complex outermembrane recepter protein
LNNDILFVNSPIQGRAFFQNVGTTLRQGVDLSAQVKTDRLLAWIAYSYIYATFQTGFTASSENNPGADANGNIQVQPGNHLPGIPSNFWKLGVDQAPGAANPRSCSPGAPICRDRRHPRDVLINDVAEPPA